MVRASSSRARSTAWPTSHADTFKCMLIHCARIPRHANSRRHSVRPRLQTHSHWHDIPPFSDWSWHTVRIAIARTQHTTTSQRDTDSATVDMKTIVLKVYYMIVLLE
eukprot:scpid28278/ scgid29336/ 